ncbi:hypothetical protein [Legionella gresilensis]|uniref:hypothetical protein n=1 Tax=Legionella gresilensis TaxID=91823 RepID=UPI001040EB22|nr:hypothetical protein [Legionella gresilensis]
MIILTPEPDQNKKSSIRHIIIKESNITVYYNGFDELLIMMDVADEFEKHDPASTLTYVIEHVTEGWKIYHAGIDANYSNDWHYHFRRKDN